MVLFFQDMKMIELVQEELFQDYLELRVLVMLSRQLMKSKIESPSLNSIIWPVVLPTLWMTTVTVPRSLSQSATVEGLVRRGHQFAPLGSGLDVRPVPHPWLPLPRGKYQDRVVLCAQWDTFWLNVLLINRIKCQSDLARKHPCYSLA
jgi:hypothetical protein